MATGGWGLRSQTPVCDTFEYIKLLNTSPKLDICIFLRSIFALSLYQNPDQVPTGFGFRSSILRYFCPIKSSSFEIFDDVIAGDLWFGPPLQSKILATPMSIPVLYLQDGPKVTYHIYFSILCDNIIAIFFELSLFYDM